MGPANSQYQLNISGFTGITIDPLAGVYSLNGMKFTTKDRDNDKYSSGNCAKNGHGRDAGAWMVAQILLIHTYKSLVQTSLFNIS